MGQLHEHEFTSLLTYAPLDVVWAHLHSCVGLASRAWLLTRPNTLSFRLSSIHFLTTLHIHFNIPHLTILYLSKCWCGHTIDDLGIHLLCCLCGNEHIVPHDTFQDVVAAIASKSGTHVQRFFTFSSATHKNKWILSSPKIVFVLWWMLSLLIWFV
jgi:hypothetical protein